MKILTAVSVAGLVAVSGLALAGNSKSMHSSPVANPASRNTPNTNDTAPRNQPTSDLLETAVASGNYSTFITVLKATGLIDTLQEKGPLTVFAPTDEAFAALPAGTLELLMQPQHKEKLANMLRFHIVPGQFRQRDLGRTSMSQPTLLGQSFYIQYNDNKLRIGTDINWMATITQSDIQCSNGFIHAIDRVIFPTE